MNSGAVRLEPKAGGPGKTFFIATAFFASGFFTFYLSQKHMHKKDDQTWITRHGQQPGVDGAPAFLGTRVVANLNTDRPLIPSSLPLPGNGDTRGDGWVSRVMAYISGRGIHPDESVPEHPLNKPQPTPQRVNAAGTHHYTKRLV